jgi:hypothetical protein
VHDASRKGLTFWVASTELARCKLERVNIMICKFRTCKKQALKDLFYNVNVQNVQHYTLEKGYNFMM